MYEFAQKSQDGKAYIYTNIVEKNEELHLPSRLFVSTRSKTIMATADQVMMRARTSIQATGELKVLYRSSVIVRLDTRVAGELVSPPLLSRTVVVVVEVRAREKSTQVLRGKLGLHNVILGG